MERVAHARGLITGIIASHRVLRESLCRFFASRKVCESDFTSSTRFPQMLADLQWEVLRLVQFTVLELRVRQGIAGGDLRRRRFVKRNLRPD